MKKIPLSSKKYPDLFALVDDEDFDSLSRFRWRPAKRRRTFYAIRCVRLENGEWTQILMHVEIMGRRSKMEIDHIDGDGLNNARANLRYATHSENLRNRRINSDNTTGFKGVHWHKASRKFQAYITVFGKRTHLGLFLTPEEAHEAYKAAAVKYHGEFGKAA